MDDPARSTAGFTLIELMIALVISGIVAGVVFDLMLGQTRFARYQNAREEVQQNARAALEVISAELRGVPPAAISSAGANQIEYRLPRAWGVLCHDALAGTGTVWVRFPAGVFPADFPTSTSASWGVALLQTDATWTFTTSTVNPGGASTCSNTATVVPQGLGAPVPAGQVFDRAFSGSGIVPVGAPRGSAVFVFETVSYDLNTSNVPRFWIRRNSQPMAGPVPALSGANAGLRFTYIDTSGAVIMPPMAAPADTAKLNTIARIGLEVRTESRAEFNNVPQLQTASSEVYLRNRN